LPIFTAFARNWRLNAIRRETLDVVVGRRSRGRLAGLLLGSISQKIASFASCIVMIVP
jgi:nucleotide-binding universal stress UspA family protein